MFLRINVVIDTTLPTFQRWINVVSTLWITVQIKLILRWKWNKIQSRIFNVAQHWYNVGVQRSSNVRCNVNVSVFQLCTMSFQLCFNVDMALSKRCFDLASTSVKAILKPIKSWICRKLIILLNEKKFFMIY